MQNRPKIREVPSVDLSPAAEARLAAASLATGGYVLEPSAEELLTAAAALLSRADTLLRQPDNLIYDHVPRGGVA